MERYICIHGHFYQPPRENPWLEEIEMQNSAHPYHDWNERITVECYAPNAASRILNADMQVIDIVDNYSFISFNFGPTLLSWMEKNTNDVYKRILEADRKSRQRFSGHGSAIAQAYNHMIMPLANKRDKYTQVIWGLKDFEYRFKRKPEAMWLPEAAVDLETLDIMAEHGIKYVILSPYQAKHSRKIGEKKWKDVTGGKIDPRTAYSCSLPSGRDIAIFFYDGPISSDVAFNGLLNNGEFFAKRLFGAFFGEGDAAQIVHIASDGETYGHHHRFGDMALAYCLHYINANRIAKITNYGEFLEKYPPENEVEIYENSSWSCFHGIERWRSNCGDNVGSFPGGTQEWRAPLREAMDWLRDTLIPIYEKELANYMHDPWKARDEYIEVILDRSRGNVDDFITKHARRELSRDEKIRVLKLLEMQKCAMYMFTSCGWYFDEISGIETTKIMQYAARAMQLAKELTGIDLEDNYLNIIERAPSNIPDFKNGRNVYNMFVKPAMSDLLRVGAHHAITSLFEAHPKKSKIYCYTAQTDTYYLDEIGRQKLAVGKATITSDITWEEGIINFAVLHLGDHNLFGGVREYLGDNIFALMHKETKAAFTRNNISEAVRIIDRYFGMHSYSLHNLFKDEQYKIFSQITDSALEGIEAYFRQIYDEHYPIMQMMMDLHIPLPRVLTNIVGLILNLDFRKFLKNEKIEAGQLQKLVNEMRKWHDVVDMPTLAYITSKRIRETMAEISRNPQDYSLMANLEVILLILSDLPVELNFWDSQNMFLDMKREVYPVMLEKIKRGEADAQNWLKHFIVLGHYLKIKID